MSSSKCLAVLAEDVHKSYGRGKQKVSALCGLNLSVEAGTIYGLLGPSGCGKTTLLRIVIGRLLIDGGNVSVFGRQPMPGPRVGYMPQELALYNELNIGEVLSFYGRLNLMASEDISERTKFMIEFLTLPDKNRRLNALSGGQKRRVSFAIALLHKPDLLILDEPTVGVDPILRTRIWEHMLDIVASDNTSKTTIIITTHYIEEARQANRVGLMRNGEILAEDTSEHLLEIHQVDTLEAVFLELCMQQDGHLGKQSNQVENIHKSAGTGKQLHGSGDDEETQPLLSGGKCSTSYTTPSSSINRNTSSMYQPTSHDNLYSCCKWSKFISLVIKDMIKMKRNIGALLFQFILPAIQIVLMCTCIGQDPRDLSVAVNNQENNTQGLAQQYLWHINNDTIIQKPVSSRLEGINLVKSADAWAVIHIGSNFTEDLLKRMKGGLVDNATLQGSAIHVNMDMTNQQISLTLQARLLSAFQSFSADALSSMGLNPELAHSPVKIDAPVYGHNDFTFTNFIAPGIILSITYILAVGLTAISFVTERKEGLLDRTWTAGVTAVELILSHFTAHLLILLVQIAVVFICVFLIFKIESEGSLILAFILTVFQGFTGMMFGLNISALCNNEVSATQVALGTFYPNLLLSGIIWPVEAMPTFLQYISKALPQTLAADSMRSILGRGWDLIYSHVWMGFVVTIGWLLLFFVTGVILVRVKKYS